MVAPCRTISGGDALVEESQQLIVNLGILLLSLQSDVVPWLKIRR
jgi:hypothetical protein